MSERVPLSRVAMLLFSCLPCLLGIATEIATPPAARGQDAVQMLPPDIPLGVVDTIIIFGNKKTKDYVILNELTIARGDTVTQGTLLYNQNRVYSLGLFTRVDVQYDSLPGLRFVYVDVNERWYIIPIPILGFRDGDPKRPYFGLGLLHNNVGGKNQKLYASVVAGNDPAASLSFSDPLVDHESRLFYSVSGFFNRVKNKSELEQMLAGSFDEYHYGFDLTLGKRLTLMQAAALTAGFRAVDVSTWYPGRTASAQGKDRYITATFSYAYDSRDLNEYPSNGTYFGGFLTKSGFGESAVAMGRIGADIRQYVPLPFGITWAMRAAANIVAGSSVPIYEHVYFGYGEQLRGWYGTIFEGEDLATTGIEFRRYLLTPRVFRMSSLPLPEEFTVWRFGISFAVFANAGSAWFRKDRLQWNSVQSGYGFGLHFLLPYSYMIRTEYAWNQFGRGQIIVDLRTSI